MTMRRLTLALLAAGFAQPAAAAGCDLSQVVGYQLFAQRTIEAYIQDGQKIKGYKGCQPDRVLVFTDSTGVRCSSVVVQELQLPKAYLFARTQTDMKMCVGDEIFVVSPAG